MPISVRITYTHRAVFINIERSDLCIFIYIIDFKIIKNVGTLNVPTFCIFYTVCYFAYTI